jgi:hypothetical protein
VVIAITTVLVLAAVSMAVVTSEAPAKAPPLANGSGDAVELGQVAGHR